MDSPLQWRHNGHDSVSIHQPHDCLLNRLFRNRSKKTPKLRATGLCVRNSPGTGEFPHKWPVTRKMLPFDDVIMPWCLVGRHVLCPGQLTVHLPVLHLTHWGRDQIDVISQTTFSNAFSRIKMNEFRLGFHWSLFLRFQLTIFQHWFR